jgi:hypothetical protein
LSGFSNAAPDIAEPIPGGVAFAKEPDDVRAHAARMLAMKVGQVNESVPAEPYPESFT